MDPGELLFLREELVNSHGLVFSQDPHFSELALVAVDLLLLSAVQVFQPLDDNFLLGQLGLVELGVCVQFNLVLALKLVDLVVVRLLQVGDLDSVALMDLWGHCVVDVLIQLVNFLENTSTQFCARACAIRQFVITLVVFAPVSSAFGFVLLNDLDLLFDDGL